MRIVFRSFYSRMGVSFLLVVILVVLLVGIFLKQTMSTVQKEVDVIVPTTTTTTTDSDSVLPYWVYYGQPWYWPVYTDPYWLYDAPYYGPIVGGSYRNKPWGYGGRQKYRPGHMGGHSGVAVGGGGGGHGGGSGHGGRGGGGGGGGHGGR